MGVELEEGGERPRSWYVSREEIERDSPSRRDGIGAAKEAELRATYCCFIRDVCIRLQLPQITIATAILLCHRFYLRQSHAKNEWQTVATVCVFLASKIEDTPCLLKRVVIVAYETMYRKNPDSAKRIHQEEVLEKQKALILVGETLLLSTIRFDFNIQHPYEPLKLALKNLGISQKEVRQVATSLINDTLPTTLVVQFKPPFIAAGSLFLAAKFRNIILPSLNGRVWWNEFDVDPKQLQVVIQQMTDLFKKRDPCSMGPVIKPVPTSTPTDKHQIKPTPTLTPALTNKKQTKLTPTPAFTNKQQIKPAPTPTPTPMDKQSIKPIPAVTRTVKQEIISTPDPALRHTQSPRRSFSNSNTETHRCVPVGSSLGNNSAGRSARYEENQYWRSYEENLYQRKHINHNFDIVAVDQRLEEQSYRVTLKADHVSEARIRSFGKKSTGRSARYEENQYRQRHEENLYQRKHINRNLDIVAVDHRIEERSYRGTLTLKAGHVNEAVIKSSDNKLTGRSARYEENQLKRTYKDNLYQRKHIDQRLEEQSWGTLKAGRVNEAGIRDLKKRRIQEVAGLPTPDYTYKCLEVREARYAETNSSWKKQKAERR